MSDDWNGLGGLVTIAIERAATIAEGYHREPLRRLRPFITNNSALQAVDAVDGLTGSGYELIRAGGATTGLAIDRVVAHRDRPATNMSNRVAGATAFGNALWGDELADRADTPGSELSLRTLSGELISLDADGLASAFNAPGNHVVALLHGLGQTEQAWADLHPELEAAGFTPLLIRYNSGRSLALNGPDLAQTLDLVISHWPVEVQRVSLVGYSLGGLVGESALHNGATLGHQWQVRAKHLISLASPHGGSPIAKGANVLAGALSRFGWTRPVGQFIDTRSEGIRDLERGDADAEKYTLIRRHRLAATVTVRDESGSTGADKGAAGRAIGRVVGDLVVRPSSALAGAGTGITDQDAVVGGRIHAGLASDPAVRRQVIDWLLDR